MVEEYKYWYKFVFLAFVHSLFIISFPNCSLCANFFNHFYLYLTYFFNDNHFFINNHFFIDNHFFNENHFFIDYFFMFFPSFNYNFFSFNYNFVWVFFFNDHFHI